MADTPKPETQAAPIVEKAMTLAERQEKIESCVSQLKKIGVPQESGFAIVNHMLSESKNVSEFDAFTKKFADGKSSSFMGLTSKTGQKKHNHSFVVIAINWGEEMIGVTTGTNGGNPHVHTIKLDIDPKIIAIEANTNMADGDPETKQKSEAVFNDFHNHSFKANVDNIKAEVPPVTTKSRYFNEAGELVDGDVTIALARGQGQGVGGAKQGDGGASICLCPSCGTSVKHERGIACAETKCPKCGTAMVGSNKKMNEITVIPSSDCSDDSKNYRFSTLREAQVLLNRVASLNEKPEWYKETLLDLQGNVFNSVIGKYPEINLDSSNIVVEMEINLAAKKKLDPKAKVRTKPSPVFPAGSKDVTDNKDHFPLGSIAQARNALARAAQYKTSPPWYKGSLAALQQKVRRAVKSKYPGIKVTGLSEFYALRFKEDQDVHFMFLGTQNLQAAQHDAGIYFSECPNARIDLVKFTCNEDGESKFSEVGNICLYDRAKATFRSCSGEVKLSEMGADGTISIEILREGDFMHEQYGDFAITPAKMQNIIKNFNDDVLRREVAFDMNHLSELPAAAWVKRLSTRNKSIDGTQRMVLLAHSKPTKRGKDAIESEDFKYFSAEYSDNFRDKESGHNYGTVLKGGGLTNRPWMPGLAPVKLSEISGGVGIMSMVEK